MTGASDQVVQVFTLSINSFIPSPQAADAPGARDRPATSKEQYFAPAHRSR